MKDDLQVYIPPELEARVVALVLGEASAFEQEELERLMADQPELRSFRANVEEMHGILEVAVEKEQADDEWKLSDERRAKVLATFQESPQEVSSANTGASQRERGRRSEWFALGGVAACFTMIAVALAFYTIQNKKSDGLVTAEVQEKNAEDMVAVNGVIEQNTADSEAEFGSVADLGDESRSIRGERKAYYDTRSADQTLREKAVSPSDVLSGKKNVENDELWDSRKIGKTRLQDASPAPVRSLVARRNSSLQPELEGALPESDATPAPIASLELMPEMAAPSFSKLDAKRGNDDSSDEPFADAFQALGSSLAAENLVEGLEDKQSFANLILPEVSIAGGTVDQSLNALCQQCQLLVNEESSKLNYVRVDGEDVKVGALEYQDVALNEVLDGVRARTGLSFGLTSNVLTVSEKPLEPWIEQIVDEPGSQLTKDALSTGVLKELLFEDATLTEVIDFFSKQVNEVRFRVANEKLALAKVDDLALKQVSIEQALRLVARKTGTHYLIDGDEVVFYESKILKKQTESLRSEE